MNPNNIRMPQDRRKVYNEYLANLDAQIENLAKTENAVRTLATTGQPPVQPTDMRTLNEKLLDIDGQKKVLRQALKEVTDGENAGIIMNTISDEDVAFLAMAFPEFAKLLRNKFATGVPAPIFNDYLQRYKSDYINTVRTQRGEAQGKTTEELLLSIRELARLAPNPAQLADLRFAVQQASRNSSIASLSSSVIAEIEQAIADMDSLLPDQDQIASLEEMDPERQMDAQQAFNDGMSSITTGATVQALTQQLQQASNPSVAKSVLEQILNNIVLTAHDREALAIAQGIAQSKSANEIQSRIEKVSKYKSLQVPKGTPQMPSEQAMMKAIQIEDLDPEDIEGLAQFQSSVLRDYIRMKGVSTGEPIPTNTLRKLTREALEAIITLGKQANWGDAVNLAEDILPPNLQAYKTQKGKERTRQEQLASIVQPPVYDINEFLTSDEFQNNLTYDQKVDYFKKLRDDDDLAILEQFDKTLLEKNLRKGPTAEPVIDMIFERFIEAMDDANQAVNESAVAKAEKKLRKKGYQEEFTSYNTAQSMIASPQEEVEILPKLTKQPKGKSFAQIEEEISQLPRPVVARKRSKAEQGVQGMIAKLKEEPTQVPIPVSVAKASEQASVSTPSEVRLASQATIRSNPKEFIKQYMIALMDQKGFESKLSKTDMDRLTAIFKSTKPLTDKMYEDMYLMNGKMLKKYQVEGYGMTGGSTKAQLDMTMSKIPHGKGGKLASKNMKMSITEKQQPKGKRISFGAGGFAKQTLTVSPETVDEIPSIPEEKSYAKLGRYLVNKHSLRDNKLIMRTVKGGQIMGLPSMTISPKLGKMINKIVSGRGFPSHDELGDMSDSDKDVMYKIFKMSHAEGLESLPKSTLKNKQERDFNEFTIAKGEILSGNNSPELIKKFKTLLLRLMSDGQIVRREGHDILLDLVALGF